MNVMAKCQYRMNERTQTKVCLGCWSLEEKEYALQLKIYRNRNQGPGAQEIGYIKGKKPRITTIIPLMA
jgi:hypothetical protein